jgi:hypothetical protein
MRFNARYVRRAAFILAAIAVLGLVAMLLWNATIPVVLAGVRTLDYRQALCLLILSRILFGGFRGRGGHPGRRWKRLESLTLEKRARFRKLRCGTNEESEGNS